MPTRHTLLWSDFLSNWAVTRYDTLNDTDSIDSELQLLSAQAIESTWQGGIIRNPSPSPFKRDFWNSVRNQAVLYFADERGDACLEVRIPCPLGTVPPTHPAIFDADQEVVIAGSVLDITAAVVAHGEGDNGITLSAFAAGLMLWDVGNQSQIFVASGPQWIDTVRWIDYFGQTVLTRYWQLDNTTAIADECQFHSNADVLERWTGQVLAGPGAAFLPSIYGIHDQARLKFRADDGSLATVAVAAPLELMFKRATRYVDVTQPLVAALITAAIGKVTTASGAVVTTCLGGARVRLQGVRTSL